MTITKTIPAERLSGLDVHPGDTLHIVAVMDSGVVIQIRRDDEVRESTTGKASEWLRSAKGSARLAAGESADDARMDFYARK